APAQTEVSGLSWLDDITVVVFLFPSAQKVQPLLLSLRASDVPLGDLSFQKSKAVFVEARHRSRRPLLFAAPDLVEPRLEPRQSQLWCLVVPASSDLHQLARAWIHGRCSHQPAAVPALPNTRQRRLRRQPRLPFLDPLLLLRHQLSLRP